MPTLTWESIVDRKPSAEGDSVASPHGEPASSAPAPTSDAAVPPPPPVAFSSGAGDGRAGRAEPASRRRDPDGAATPARRHQPRRHRQPRPSLPPACQFADRRRTSTCRSHRSRSIVTTAPWSPEPGSSLDSRVRRRSRKRSSIPRWKCRCPAIREATPVEPYVSDEIPAQAAPSALPTTTVRDDRRRCDSAHPRIAARADRAATGDPARSDGAHAGRPDQPARRGGSPTSTGEEASWSQRAQVGLHAGRARRDRRRRHRLRTSRTSSPMTGPRTRSRMRRLSRRSPVRSSPSR